MNWLKKFVGKIPNKTLTQGSKNVNIKSAPKGMRSTYDLIGPADKISNMRTPTTNAPSRFFPNQVQMDEVSKYADGMLRVVSGLGGRPAKRRK